MKRSDGGRATIPTTPTRRDFFQLISDGIYGAALTSLLAEDVYGEADSLRPEAVTKSAAEPVPGVGREYDLIPRRPPFEPKAKAVIQFLMNGAPSPMDLLDPKPMLEKYRGQSFVEKAATETTVLADQRGLLPSPFKFAQHGRSGLWVSEVMPHLAEQVDEIAVIRSMHTTSPVHPLALCFFQSGQIKTTRPTLGAWVVYGLGSENQNLPAFVVLDDPLGLPINGVINWQSGFLPAIYQGTRLRSTGDPILNLRPEGDDPPELVQLGRRLMDRLDRAYSREHPLQPQVAARIATYELAARMQVDASDALDLSQETGATLAMYGVGQGPALQGIQYRNPGPDNYARRCIMARRLVERGVRYVQICLNSQIWDTHAYLEDGIRGACDRTDKPVAALLKDLKQRGLLDSTLVIWGGEFGRLPNGQMSEGNKRGSLNIEGRDHNSKGFCLWLAGGGVKGGTVYGATDELGFRAVENPVSVADFHATVLHLLGFDHRQLYYEVDGQHERLTANAEAKVVNAILA
jgi:hypothetical protein